MVDDLDEEDEGEDRRGLTHKAFCVHMYLFWGFFLSSSPEEGFSEETVTL